MNELEKAAEKYAETFRFISETDSWFNNKYKTFIAGATSSYVEKEKIKLLISENKSILEMLKLHGNERVMIPLIDRIKELEQKLLEYGK